MTTLLLLRMTMRRTQLTRKPAESCQRAQPPRAEASQHCWRDDPAPLRQLLSESDVSAATQASAISVSRSLEQQYSSRSRCGWVGRRLELPLAACDRPQGAARQHRRLVGHVPSERTCKLDRVSVPDLLCMLHVYLVHSIYVPRYWYRW